MTFSKLLLKGIFLIVFILAILQIIGGAVDKQIPYYWANSKFDNNFDFFDENKNEVNTIFMGSSFTLTGFNPMLFDSLTDNKTKSINLGWEFCVIPETHFLLDHFIENYSVPNNEQELTVFFELNKLHPIKKHENTNRFYYMLNGASFNVLWESINKQKINYFDKFKLRNNLIQGFAINYFNVGIIGDKIKYYLLGTERKQKDDLRMNKGFRPAKRSLKKKDTKPFKRYMKEIERNRSTVNEDYPFLFKYTTELIQKASEKNINLIFVMMPGLIDPPVMSLSEKLSQDQLLDFCIPNSVLFDMENRKNFGHLNKKGAGIFTNLLAKEFIKRN